LGPDARSGRPRGLAGRVLVEEAEADVTVRADIGADVRGNDKVAGCPTSIGSAPHAGLTGLSAIVVDPSGCAQRLSNLVLRQVMTRGTVQGAQGTS